MRNVSLLLLMTLVLILPLFHSCTKEAANPATTGAGGSMARYTVAGNYLYIADNSELHAYDISDPTTPYRRSSQYIGFNIETIYQYKGKLFIGSANGMYVYSLVNPENPLQEGAITHVRSCDPVVANDSVAYVTLRTGVSCGGNRDILNVYNLRNPNSPSLVRTIDLQSPYGLGVAQKALYVCQGENGMVVFDLADPYNPRELRAFKDESYFDVIPYHGVLICFVSHGILLYDISEPLVPKKLSGVLK